MSCVPIPPAPLMRWLSAACLMLMSCHSATSVRVAGAIVAGAAVANGVVYVQSLDGEFYALDAATGALLHQMTSGGQSSGPSISRGRIYLGAGDVMASVFNVFHVPVGGAIIALGLPE